MEAYEEKEEEKEKEEGGKTWGIEKRWTEWNEKRATGRRTGGRGGKGTVRFVFWRWEIQFRPLTF